VQLLVEKGFGDMDARDHRGRTPLMVAAAPSTEPDGPPPSHEITTLLLDAGADLHAVDNDHRGVLHYTVSNKQRDASRQAVGGWSPNCLRLFLKRGANPNLQDIRVLHAPCL
jgi:ankyrin repeat protein